MSKKDHDETIAKYRSVAYHKQRFVHGLNIIKDLNLNNFSMLDMGCGNGDFSELVKNNFKADISCVDYSETHLTRVKELGFKTIKCNFDNNEDIKQINETLKNSFDLIVALDVIEHIFDVDSFLSTAHNLLKENGLMIISTPNISYISNRLYSKFRGNLPVGDGHHVRFFNHRRLQQFLFLNGFDVVRDYSFGKGNYWLDRAIGENKSSLRALYIKTLFRLWYFMTSKSSLSYYSQILFLAKKADTIPIGLEVAFRSVVYNELSIEGKKKVINRLYPLRTKFFFDEHPGLRKFIDEEKKIIGYVSGST